MSPHEQLTRLGGIAVRSELSASKRELRRAVDAGTIAHPARGRYALASVDRSVAAAHTYSAHLCLLSAALHHGWAVREPPTRHQLSLPRDQRRKRRPPGVEAHFLRLHDDDCDGVATTRERTLLDCLRLLPFPDAVAVADSALREGLLPTQLYAWVRDMRGPGSVRARRIAHLADGRAANPFESTLRAIAYGVAGLAVVPQVDITQDGAFLGRPDLVDERLGLVIEAESFEWHGGSTRLTADARRYNALTLANWMVLRFAWVDVMRHPADVARALETAVLRRTNRCGCDRRSRSVAPSAALVTIGPFEGR